MFTTFRCKLFAPEVLHVHVPHYCALFGRLLARPRPWRFGHLYLPGGSASLGSPDFDMVPGSQAPLVGTLMEVLHAVRFPDGRLLILAVGLSRFKVVRTRQNTPHPRADIVLLPDYEEVQQQQELALEALEDTGASGELSVAAAMQALVVAAERAAAAASQVWWRYEISLVAAEAQRGSKADVIKALNEDEARAFGRRLVAIGNTPVAALPGLDPEQDGSWESDSSGDDQDGHSEAEPAGSFPSTSCTACRKAAVAAAMAAATETLLALTGKGEAASGAHSSNGSCIPEQGNDTLGMGLSGIGSDAETALLPGFSLAHSSPGRLQGINSTAERGIAPLPEAALEADLPANERGAAGKGRIDGAAKEVAEDIGAGASRSVAMRLEELVWRELDAVMHLAARLRAQPVPLGEGLVQLRPPQLGLLVPQLPEQQQGRQEVVAEEQHGTIKSVASVLADLPASEGRQALLEAPSISARLRLALAALRKHRSVLAAVVAVKGLGPGGEAAD
ncbi:hypothetical protein N2152v2_006469 [Parachlorella kessleri]